MNNLFHTKADIIKNIQKKIFIVFNFLNIIDLNFILQGIFLNYFMEMIEMQKFYLISKYLKENGYVTGYAADYCQKDNIRNKHNLTFSELYDHQLLLCDPNVDDLNSVTKRCLYGQINSYHLYEYINQFWRKYQNNRKYSLIVVNDGHEGKF